jgi:hypothetical protein
MTRATVGLEPGVLRFKVLADSATIIMLTLTLTKCHPYSYSLAYTGKIVH